MKKLLFLFSFLCLLTLGCNDADDDNYPALEGEWNLVKITTEMVANDVTIPEGLITYNFNTNQNSVTIHNNTELLFPVSGIYPYTIETDPTSGTCIKTLQINDESQYCFTLEGNNMILDLSAVDGLRLDFKR